MKMGELAKQTGCDIETIRYYEKSGLLPEPGRVGAGYRFYLPEHLERLQFIRHCRSLQMRLADIKVLLDLRGRPTAACQGVNDLLDHHIDLIRVRMEVLTSLEVQLTKLRHQCHETHSTQECGILQTLSDDAVTSTA